MKTWFLHIMTWTSQTLNVWVLFGHPDQSISARAYVNRTRPRWRTAYKIINKIFFWQVDHCYTAHHSDLKRAEYIQSLGK
jgi:hypothetical protein